MAQLKGLAAADMAAAASANGGAAPQAEQTNKSNQQPSLHGETAVRRQAITELLFFCSVGDLHRAKKIVHSWGLDVSSCL
jgi:hypothetical protein